eukprot:31071-Pelagococcus_subviridis.AAC.22
MSARGDLPSFPASHSLSSVSTAYPSRAYSLIAGTFPSSTCTYAYFTPASDSPRCAARRRRLAMFWRRRCGATHTLKRYARSPFSAPPPA